MQEVICPVMEDSLSFKYYVSSDYLFNLILEIHLAFGHNGRNHMFK
jgi:hypothetical protein